MLFPQTSLTLVERLAFGGREEDWWQFVQDYHGPVCRFALRSGATDLDDADEIALETFEILWRNRLLTRWVNHQTAKLRSLLCAVVRNLLSNRRRVQEGRRRLMPDLIERMERIRQDREEQSDVFYSAWVEDLVQQSVEAVAGEFRAQGKGDHIRVFYGRLCQGLSIAEVAQALELSPATVDHDYRQVRDRLAGVIEDMVLAQVGRYCAEEDAAEELAKEWRQLRDHLSRHGGLDEAVRQAYQLLDPVRRKGRAGNVGRVAARLTTTIRAGPVESS
jgi:DNA-directed RNA polymerase specialized sigma24 family protein